MFLFIGAGRPMPARKIELRGSGQGTTWAVTYYANDTVITKGDIDSLIAVIDQSLSVYLPSSLISKFNRSAKGARADKHLETVVNSAIETYHATGGLFDITIYPLTAAWGFGATTGKAFPGEKEITRLTSCVSTRFLSWKDDFLQKSKPCVQLDPNGIAQGYTVDLIAELLERNGVQNYLAELGGEIRVNGRKPDGSKMVIGIEAPASKFDIEALQKLVYLGEGAITTSGSYRRYVESGGKKITHLIHPKTGQTLRNELLSVTVYAKDAMTADAYDNALMMMGLNSAIEFVESRPELAAHFIYFKQDGMVADTASSRFEILLKP